MADSKSNDIQEKVDEHKIPLLEIKYRRYSTFENETIAKGLGTSKEQIIEKQPIKVRTTPIRRLGSRIWENPYKANYSDEAFNRLLSNKRTLHKQQEEQSPVNIELVTKRKYRIHEQPTLILSEGSTSDSDIPEEIFKYKIVVKTTTTDKESFSKLSSNETLQSTPIKMFTDNEKDSLFSHVTERRYQISEHPTLVQESPSEYSDSDSFNLGQSPVTKQQPSVMERYSKEYITAKFRQLSLNSVNKQQDTNSQPSPSTITTKSSRTSISISPNLTLEKSQQEPIVTTGNSEMTTENHQPKMIQNEQEISSPTTTSDSSVNHSLRESSSPIEKIGFKSPYAPLVLQIAKKQRPKPRPRPRRRRRKSSKLFGGPLANRLARRNRQLNRYIHFEFDAVVNGYRRTRQERLQHQLMVISKHAIEILNSIAKDIIRKYGESADQLMRYSGRKRMNEFVAISVLKMMLAEVQFPRRQMVYREFKNAMERLRERKHRVQKDHEQIPRSSSGKQTSNRTSSPRRSTSRNKQQLTTTIQPTKS